MIEIGDWITQERDCWKSIVTPGMGGGAWLMQEFLLRNGRKFVSQAKPRRYKMRTPKFCFYNSRRLVTRSRGALRYAEGYAASPEVPILIHHAWAVDSEDRVIDVTLQNYDTRVSRSATTQYFGIVFPKEVWPRDGGESMLDSGRGFRVDLWLRVDPAFRFVLEEATGVRLKTA
jgi:hypothetical protein